LQLVLLSLQFSLFFLLLFEQLFAHCSFVAIELAAHITIEFRVFEHLFQLVCLGVRRKHFF